MDTAILVVEQIDDGKRLIDHLKGNSFPVAVAVWVLTGEERLWFLYIASSVVDDEGLAKAYGRVYRELSRCQIRWVSRSDIKLVGARDPIAVDAITYRSNNLPTRYGGRKLGSLIVEEAHIY